MCRALAMCIATSLSLCLAIAQPTAERDSSFSLPPSLIHRETVHSTMVGVGTSNVLDSYLSPYNYTGVDVRLQRETMRMLRRWDGRVATQSLIDINCAFNENRPGSMNEYAGGIRYSHGWYYMLHGSNIVNPVERSATRWNVAAGLAASAYLGCVYIDRSGNNPAQAKASLTVDASLLATCRLHLLRRNFLLRGQVSVPMTGVAFSPNYGQSYYETFVLGHYDKNAVFVHPFNMPSLHTKLTLDIPLRSADLRIGYMGQIDQSKFNNLKYHNYSHAFMIGFNKYFYRK